MGLKNTKTEENLRKALAGESIARNKYTYFAAAARACGDTEVADAFEEMARNEMTHARFWFEQLYGKPTDTKECLIKAA
ncbi:MAG: rubrerythrin family protein, partial [Oscillospiraceae bacterium]|nr:rubrerythrin family protein [Oscillospiraceae bacterium]